MFSLFSNGKKGEKIVALIDIGSGSIGGALAKLNHDGKPSLLFCTREELPMHMNRTAQQLMKDTLEVVDRILVSVRKSAALWNENNRITPLSITHTAVFLAAPWSATSIHTLVLEKKAPFVMSNDILKKMLAEEIKKSADHLENTLVIEKVALGLKLNGYPIDSLSSAKIEKAEVTLAVTHAPQIVIKEIEGKIASGVGKTTFHSFSIPAGHALFSSNASVLDTLLIDAGAEITELVLFKDKTPTARATIPVGTHILLRTLTSHAKMVKGEAETAMKLASIEGTRLGETHRDALYGAAKEWSREVSKALVSLTDSGSIPSSIHLFADHPARTWFKDALATEPYPRGTEPFASIASVDGKEFEPFLDARVPGDPFLYAELLYADSRFDENVTLELMGNNPLMHRPKAPQASGILQTTSATAPEKETVVQNK